MDWYEGSAVTGALHFILVGMQQRIDVLFDDDWKSKEVER